MMLRFPIEEDRFRTVCFSRLFFHGVDSGRKNALDNLYYVVGQLKNLVVRPEVHCEVEVSRGLMVQSLDRERLSIHVCDVWKLEGNAFVDGLRSISGVIDTISKHQWYQVNDSRWQILNLIQEEVVKLWPLLHSSKDFLNPLFAVFIPYFVQLTEDVVAHVHEVIVRRFLFPLLVVKVDLEYGGLLQHSVENVLGWPQIEFQR